jgi:hypothetical protein
MSVITHHPWRVTGATLLYFLAANLIATPVQAGPICTGLGCSPLYVIIYGPYVLGISAVIFISWAIISYRRRRPLHALRTIAGSLAVGLALTMSYQAVIAPVLDQRSASAAKQRAAQATGISPYLPAQLPSGYRLTHSTVTTDFAPYLAFDYENASDRFTLALSQNASGNILTAPTCTAQKTFITDGGSSVSWQYNGPCRVHTTPGGSSVATATINFTQAYPTQLAFISRGNTLITISGYNLSDAALDRLVDSLQATPVEQVSFPTSRSSLGY